MPWMLQNRSEVAAREFNAEVVKEDSKLLQSNSWRSRRTLSVCRHLLQFASWVARVEAMTSDFDTSDFLLTLIFLVRLLRTENPLPRPDRERCFSGDSGVRALRIEHVQWMWQRNLSQCFGKFSLADMERLQICLVNRWFGALDQHTSGQAMTYHCELLHFLCDEQNMPGSLVSCKLCLQSKQTNTLFPAQESGNNLNRNEWH